MDKKDLDNIIRCVKNNSFTIATFSDRERKISIDMEAKVIKITDMYSYEYSEDDDFRIIYYPVMEFYSINQRRLSVYECTLEKLDKEYHKEIPILDYPNIFLLERYCELFYAINYLKKINYRLHFSAYEKRLELYKKEIDKRKLSKEINNFKKSFRDRKDSWNSHA